MIRLTRKRGGRSYEYNGGAVPINWEIQDEKGNFFATAEDYKASIKPKRKRKTSAQVKAEKEQAAAEDKTDIED